MKILLPLTMFILISTTALAMDSSEKKLRPTDNRDIRELQTEVNMLRQDVQKLEALILQMQRTLNTLANDSDRVDNHNQNNQWGCYMNDLRAGGIYATGRTEAEARGKALASCTEKKGTCWDDNLKCTSSE